jgi:hypothetical protein
MKQDAHSRKTGWFAARAAVLALTMAGCAAEDADETALDVELAETEAALTTTLFSDGFETNLSKWTVSGSCARSSSAKSVGSYGARCDKTASLTTTFSTVGYTNIRFTYARRTAYYESAEYLRAEWSPNGSTWTQIEQTAASSFSTPSFTLPAGAAGQAALRLRLRSNASGLLDRFDADAVSVTGDSAPAAPVCGNATCETGETCSSCSADCGACAPVCGNATCEAGESCSTCSADCGACAPVCGNATCEAGESCSTCSADCGTCGPVCGNATCEAGESCSSCSADCGACAPTVNDPSVNGTYASCYYTANISRPEYAAARVFYPCAAGSGTSGPIASGVFAASTLSPGFTNGASTIYWLGQHLSTHGFIVLAMEPDNTWGNNPEWRDAHVAAYNELIEENGRSGGPIVGRVNVNKIQIMGYSKGGGGALMAAQQLSSQGKVIGAVQPLAPYFDSWSNVNLITAPVAIHGGSSDIIAPTGSHAVPMFNGLASGTKRLLAIYSGLSHSTWTNSSSADHPHIKQYITSWMKVYLDGNAGYQTYINGARHNGSWFSTFNYVP